MLLQRFAACLLYSVCMLTLGAGAVSGQGYPNKPVRIIMTGVGGGTDFVARIIAQGLTSSLGQQVIVDSRPSGVIAGDFVAKSPPDGYTLHMPNAIPTWLLAGPGRAGQEITQGDEISIRIVIEPFSFLDELMSDIPYVSDRFSKRSAAKLQKSLEYAE